MNKSDVDGVISIKDICIKMSRQMPKIEEVKSLRTAGKSGVLWATDGGEAEATSAERFVAVDGIHNVINVLEEIEDGKLDDIEFVEALACRGGCVGGPLTAENSFAARSKIQRICKYIDDGSEGLNGVESFKWDRSIVYRPVMNLDPDINEAMRKMNLIEELYEHMPKLDCGSCGSPSCRALAEDIVRGYAKETDCIFKLRDLADEALKMRGKAK